MIWTLPLRDAVRDVLHDPAPNPHGQTTSVQERAQEIHTHARVGDDLKSWQVEIVICLIQRLDTESDPKARASHLALHRVWREANQ
jgi:hypothetical protein